MSIKLTYAASFLEKSQVVRSIDYWLDPSQDVVVTPVWNSLNLINTNTNSSVLLDGAEAELVLKESEEKVALGQRDQKMVVAASVKNTRIVQKLTALSSQHAFIDLRALGAALNQADANLLAYARGMIYWHINHSYCSSCGSKTQQTNGGHVRSCTNKLCSLDKFPRVDPAVIMLITDEGGSESKCLLGRNRKWPSGCYSTLAGFVEPGESIEEAVVREVDEEVGIKIFDVQYLASQPWPFPSSLMLGFRARAATTSLKINEEELEDARWFTKNELVDFGFWGSDGNGYKKPRADSIANWLIMDWLK